MVDNDAEYELICADYRSIQARMDQFLELYAGFRASGFIQLCDMLPETNGSTLRYAETIDAQHDQFIGTFRQCVDEIRLLNSDRATVRQCLADFEQTLASLHQHLSCPAPRVHMDTPALLRRGMSRTSMQPGPPGPPQLPSVAYE